MLSLIWETPIFDELVESRKISFFVIPEKAGIQDYQLVTKSWTPAFAGVTTFYEAIIF